jgi:hypothetical protein
MSAGSVLQKIDNPWGYAAALILVGGIGCLFLLRTPAVKVVSIVATPEQTLFDEFPTKLGDPFAYSDKSPRFRLAPPRDPGSDCELKMKSLGVVAENCFDIEPIIRTLRSGAYTYNKLERAYVGVPFRMVLVLKTAENQSDGSAFVTTEGKPITLEAAFGQSVDAGLRGIDLLVDPAGPQRRTATLINSVEWEWVITPLKSGNKTLMMDVIANIYLKSPNAIPYQVRALRQDIDIVVTPFQYAKEILGDTGSAIMGLGAVVLSLTGMVASISAFRKRVRRYLRTRRRRILKVP